MIFGAMVAGMTSEGGGAVAFPVMTLALHISPSVARDFSLMIQACGMSAAAFTIFWMKLKVEKHSLLFCSLGNTGKHVETYNTELVYILYLKQMILTNCISC